MAVYFAYAFELLFLFSSVVAFCSYNGIHACSVFTFLLCITPMPIAHAVLIDVPFFAAFYWLSGPP